MRAYLRVISVILLGGIGGGLLVGCAMGGVPVNYYLDLLIKDSIGDSVANGGLVIRLASANAGLIDQEVDLLITYRDADGSGQTTMETTTFTCRADELTCDFILQDCPILVEALQERRYDALGRFRGSRDLSGIDDFSFELGDYECGGFVVYQFSDLEAIAYAY